ncbi:MAG TPA: ATP-binding protein [Alphaproteobacteria bacterium]|nr:ATP-binding protein [Alphaproteobacteria bacterium]
MLQALQDRFQLATSRAGMTYLFAAAGVLAFYYSYRWGLFGSLPSIDVASPHGGEDALSNVTQMGIVVTLLVLSGLIGWMLETIAFMAVVIGFAFWATAAIGVSVYARKVHGVEVDSVPALIVPMMVYFTALIRQHETVLRERFVKNMAIQHRDALIQSVIEHNGQGVFICDEEGRIVFCNHAGVEIFGRTEAETIGASIDVLSPTLTQGRVGREISAYIAEAREQRTKIGPITASGIRAEGDSAPFPIELTIDVVRHIIVDHPMEMRRADRLLFICYIADASLTSRVMEVEANAQTSVALAARARDEFLANMSHELRTPLNAVIGFSELLRAGVYGKLNEQQSEQVRSIHGSAEHLLKIINDILDMSKLEAGHGGLHEEDLDIREVIHSCITLIKPRADETRLTIRVRELSSLYYLHADERRVKQVLINLLSNAVKFTPMHGKIDILVRFTQERGCAVQVVDTGEGIPDEMINVCLTPFGQVDSGLDRKYEGTGLGLPLAKSFMEAHGGTLELTSIVGVGTTVTITFPPSRSRELVPGTPATTAEPLPPPRSRLLSARR